MQPLPPVVPVTELRHSAKDLLAQAMLEPIVISQNGRAAAVLIGFTAYNRLVERLNQLEQASKLDRAAWSALSESSLNRLWDNPVDAAYDDWKALYGL